MKRAYALIRTNFLLKCISVLIAFIAWAGVAYSENPPTSMVFDVPVPQSSSLLPSGFVLLRPIQDLHLSVSGTKVDLGNFSMDDLTVAPAYTRISRPGVQKIPVSIASTDSRIELVDAPSEISVDVDKLASTTVAVTVKVKGNPPAGYTVTASSAVPATVRVTAPEHDLTGIEAVAPIDLSSSTSSVQIDTSIEIVNQSEEPVPFATASPSSVAVSAAIAATTSTRVAVIIPNTFGSVASGYELTGIVVSPTIVTLSGPDSALSVLESIRTSPIDLTQLSSTEVVTISLELPSGVSASPTTVEVQLVIAKIPGITPTPTPSPSPSPSP